MGYVWVDYVRNIWAFSLRKVDDLKESDRLISKLGIPEHCKEFVYAISEPESDSVIYILSAQNLSERSVRDVECLVREVRPDAVVAVVGNSTLSEIHEHELVEGADDLVPTSAFRVLMRCFIDRTNREMYEHLAGNLVLKEIFGVGFCGHFFAARNLAEEVGSSFFVLESPNTKSGGGGSDTDSEAGAGNIKFQHLGLQAPGLVSQNLGPIVSNTRRFFVTNDLQLQMVKLVGPSLAHSLVKLTPSVSSVSPGPAKVEPLSDYCPPPFMQMVYPLLMDLHDIFSDIPSIGRALAYAQKMFLVVDKGESVSADMLSEVYTFQIAVEGLRVALNNAGKLPIGNLRHPVSDKNEFQELSVDERSNCLLAYALRNQAKKYKKVVAVVDAGSLAGLRKFWNTAVPPEVGGMVEELVLCQDLSSESSKDRERKRLLSAKPVVAVGAGATAVLGASSLSKAVPVSTVVKVVTFNIPASLKLFITQTHKATAIVLSKILGPTKIMAPGFASSGAKASTGLKAAAASAEKIRMVTHSVIASAEKSSFSAMRTAFYEIMRKRRVQPIGFVPWATFGCSMATCVGLLAFGDGIECVAESLPAAPSIASLGRGIQNLQQASEAVRYSCEHQIHKAMESLMYRLKKKKIP